MKNIFLINNDKKNAFLENIEYNYKPPTYKLYKKLMIRLDEFENYKKASVENFTKADFIELLTSLNSISLSVLYTYRSAINSYLIFISDNTQFKIGILELNKITKDDLIECINIITEKNQFITEKEYMKIINNNKGNYQDKLVVILLWNKIKGEKEYSEIRSLKKEDIDIENNIIVLPDRIVIVTKEEMDIIKKAINEPYYEKVFINKNNIVDRVKTEYVDTPYLIKSSYGARNINLNNDICPYSTLANRMSRYFNIVLKRSELTGLKIYKSSIYYYMLLEYKRKLTISELQDYLNKNNLRMSYSFIYREQNIMYEKLVKQRLI